MIPEGTERGRWCERKWEVKVDDGKRKTTVGRIKKEMCKIKRVAKGRMGRLKDKGRVKGKNKRE